MKGMILLSCVPAQNTPGTAGIAQEIIPAQGPDSCHWFHDAGRKSGYIFG